MQFTDHRFTVSEVSALTETNLNTIQSWRRKGYFALGESEGWHRFTVPEVFSVAVFAEVTASTGNQEVASAAGSMAVQMLAEIIENEAAPYFVGSARKGEAPVMELTYGARDVGRILADLIERGADAGAYVVVDYSAIFLRLFKRLQDGGYAERKSGGRCLMAHINCYVAEALVLDAVADHPRTGANRHRDHLPAPPVSGR